MYDEIVIAKDCMVQKRRMNILAKRSHCRGGDRRIDNTGPSPKFRIHECKAIIDTDEQCTRNYSCKKTRALHMEWIGEVHLTDDLHIIFDVTGDEVGIR